MHGAASVNWAQSRLAAMRHLNSGLADPCTGHGMTAGSPNKTFEPGAVGTLLRGQKIPSNFPEADTPRCPICHGNAAPCSNVSEAQIATFAKSGLRASSIGPHRCDAALTSRPWPWRIRAMCSTTGRTAGSGQTTLGKGELNP